MRSAELICADNGCAAPVTDTLYSACYGCSYFFCDAHLLYCTAHDNQHCAICCDNDTAPTKRVQIAGVEE